MAELLGLSHMMTPAAVPAKRQERWWARPQGGAGDLQQDLLPEVTRHRNFPGKERRGMKGQGIPATGVGTALGDEKEGS